MNEIQSNSNTKCGKCSNSKNKFQNTLLEEELKAFLGEDVMVILRALQLNVLNQTFRPIMLGKLVELNDEFAVFEKVNIKMSNAPEFIFPTPLIIPLNEIAYFMEFKRDVRISLY